MEEKNKNNKQTSNVENTNEAKAGEAQNSPKQNVKNSEKSLEEKWQAEYEVPKNEKNTVHVLLEKPKFDTTTGERMSKPRVQKFDPKEYHLKKDILPVQGYRVTVLHKPATKKQ